jgi:molybdopterin-binding protein
MSIHTLPPGGFTPERIAEIARAGQEDPVVRGYRSFHSLSEGRIVWLLEAPGKQAVADWCARVGLPLDAVTELELEGHVGFLHPIRTSLPNRIRGVITDIAQDPTMALVSLDADEGGLRLVAAVDVGSVDEMGLGVGNAVSALVKATTVSLEKEGAGGALHMKLSFPNQIKGRVTEIITGPTLVIVYVDTPAGPIVSAIIPQAAESISLKVGDEVTALFKALDVSLAKE